MGSQLNHSLALISPLLVLLCLSVVSAFAEAPQADPIEWTKPASRPEFRELIVSEEYEARFQAALQEIGSLDDLKASTILIAGTRIVSVTPDSQAVELGIKVGDRVTHCNGDVLWKRGQLGFDREGERELRLVGSSGDVRMLELQPGKIGIDSRDFWHPELEYLRIGPRDPRWDREVVIGLMMCETDPELAETCWAHAIAAGFPRDHYSAASGAAIAMNHGRVEVAADFAFFCLEGDGADAVHPHLLFRVAMANYKLKHALSIVQQGTAHFNPDNASVLKELISLHEQRALEDRLVPTPSQLAEQMYRDDFRSRAIPLDDHPATKRHVERLRASPEGNLTAATANYVLAAFGPPLPARNVDLQVRFRLRATDGETSSFLKNFECALVDVEHWSYPERLRRGSETLLFAGLQDDGTVRTTAGGLPASEFINFRVSDGWENDQTIRLVRVRGQGEIFINGKRIIYAPVHDDVDFVSIVLKSVGMDVEIRNLEVAELIERL